MQSSDMVVCMMMLGLRVLYWVVEMYRGDSVKVPNIAGHDNGYQKQQETPVVGFVMLTRLRPHPTQ